MIAVASHASRTYEILNSLAIPSITSPTPANLIMPPKAPPAPVMRMITNASGFYPLCVDTAGGWAADANEALSHCAQFIAKERRGRVAAENSGFVFE